MSSCNKSKYGCFPSSTDESPLDIFAHDDAALSEQYESRNRSAIPGRARNRKRTAVTNRNSL